MIKLFLTALLIFNCSLGWCAFPTTGILDNFNRANEGPPPSSNWTNGFGGGQKVVSNTLAYNSGVGTESGDYWNPSTYLNVEVYLTIATLPLTTEGTGLYFRANNTLSSGYFVFWKYDSVGTDTIVVSDLAGGNLLSVNQDLTTGDSFGVSMVGSLITIYAKTSGVWNVIGSVNDSKYTSAGRIGSYNFSAIGRWDDFGGGNIPESIKLSNAQLNNFKMQ